MGHIHLGVLPNTKPWQEVVALIEMGAEAAGVAALAAKAAERSLLSASTDPVFVEAIRLLVSIPIAARSSDFGDALRHLDLAVGAGPGFIDVLSSASTALDRVDRIHPGRTDFTVLASRAFAKAITDCVGTDLPGLFAPTAEDVQLSFAKYSRGAGLSALCRSYFSALVGSSLSYWLDRVLAGHVGEGKRFLTVSEKSRFDRALEFHVTDATRIIQEFSAGWVGKTVYEKGAVRTEDARNFGHVCLRKVVEELRDKRGQND